MEQMGGNYIVRLAINMGDTFHFIKENYTMPIYLENEDEINYKVEIHKQAQLLLMGL